MVRFLSHELLFFFVISFCVIFFFSCMYYHITQEEIPSSTVTYFLWLIDEQCNFICSSYLKSVIILLERNSTFMFFKVRNIFNNIILWITGMYNTDITTRFQLRLASSKTACPVAVFIQNGHELAPLSSPMRGVGCLLK